MLNLFQHLFQDLYISILNQVQGDNIVFPQQILISEAPNSMDEELHSILDSRKYLTGS